MQRFYNHSIPTIPFSEKPNNSILSDLDPNSLGELSNDSPQKRNTQHYNNKNSGHNKKARTMKWSDDQAYSNNPVPFADEIYDEKIFVDKDGMK